MTPRDKGKRWLTIIVAWLIIRIVSYVLDWIFVDKLGAKMPSTTASDIVCIFLLNDWYERTFG